MRRILVLSIFILAACASAKQKPSTPPPAAQAPAPTAPATLATAPTKSAVKTPSAASSAPAENPVDLACENHKDLRELGIEKKDKGCSLNYTKAGKLTSVASSAHGLKHCMDVQKKIRNKLETAGFKCKEK